jgi:hypothetical protein
MFLLGHTPAYIDELSTSLPSLSCSDLLNESDRRLDEKFIELERQQLERALKASSSALPEDRDPANTPTPSWTPSPPPPSPWDDTPRQPQGTSLERATVGRDDGGTSQAKAKGRPVVAEWWTMGQNALMDGALRQLIKDVQPSAPGACLKTLLRCTLHCLLCVLLHDCTRHCAASVFALQLIEHDQTSAAAHGAHSEHQSAVCWIPFPSSSPVKPVAAQLHSRNV